MMHEDAHAPDSSDRPYFPAEEWNDFIKDDTLSAKAIVILMSSIFTIGLVLYTLVALSVGL